MMQQSVHLKPAGGNSRTERGLTARSRSIHRIRDSTGQGPFSSMLVLSYIGLVNPNGTKMETKKKKKTVSTEVQRALARISSSLLVSSWPVHWRSRSLWNLYIHAYGPSSFDEPLTSAMSAKMACDRSAEGAATRVPTILIQRCRGCAAVGLGQNGSRSSLMSSISKVAHHLFITYVHSHHLWLLMALIYIPVPTSTISSSHKYGFK